MGVKEWSVLVLTEGRKVGVVSCCPVHGFVTCRMDASKGVHVYNYIHTNEALSQTTPCHFNCYSF